MKLILDTNIWYDVETNEIFQNKKLKSFITVTLLNYLELIKNPRIITDPILFRKIFNKMDDYQRTFEPPFVHIAKLHEFYNYNVLLEQNDYIRFVLNFKKGDFIDPAKVIEYKNYIKNIDKDFEDLANWYNEYAFQIKSKIKDLKKHRLRDSSQSTNDYIRFIVNKATQKNLETFDFKEIELLCCTLDVFFKKLEVGEFKMKTNDIIDYMLLSYVQPGDLYYTKDKKWIDYISIAGKSEYLYNDGT